MLNYPIPLKVKPCIKFCEINPMKGNFPKRPKMNINPMQSAHCAKRCGAHARTTGQPCKSPAMENGRCRMHGGKSTGAPTGKANGNYKHGRQTIVRIEERRYCKSLIRNSSSNTKHLNGLLRAFRKQARILGVKWPVLWRLCLKGDGKAALVLFICKRLQKIEEKNQRMANH